MFRLERSALSKLKPYSILNAPSQKGRLDFAIKIVEGGHASECFKDMKVGDTFETKGPFGHFFFKEESSASRFCFIGTGTGIAPFYSMIAEFAPKFPQKHFHLVFGVRKKEGLFLHEEFQALAAKYPNVEYWPTLSREEWEGRSGRVQTHLREDIQDKEFYICGLKEMVEDTTEHLIAMGVEREKIHFERYS
jgi:ferredoxin-NADP reductase